MECGRVNAKYELAKLGYLGLGSIAYNLEEPALITEILQRREGNLGLGGSVLVSTGKHTGRSPKDKYVVTDPLIESKIWWEKNGRMSPTEFDLLYSDILNHMKGRDYFVQDLFASANPDYRLNIRLITELAWHALFIRHLLRRPKPNKILNFVPEFTVINCPKFLADPKKYGCRSETIIAINFERKMVIICGTEYAGENKKCVFTILNKLLPEQDVMPMHCSANHHCEDNNNAAIFFGLSGTGKTTLSQDPKRILIGDDEHGWSDTGIFNFEGGCYAKTINLSEKSEPEIYSTMSKFGTVVENMIYDPNTLELDYTNDSITANMRAAYPLNYISNISGEGKAGHPKNVIFLTCDAFGVLPPLSKLSTAQAIYHFLSGFTSKAPGTETGVIQPEPTFSACFAAPFLPLKPEIYGNLLKEKICKAGSSSWLVNTGWTGGTYGSGSRMPIHVTRSVLTAVLEGTLEKAEFRQDKNFGFLVPLEVSGVDSYFLNPRENWKSSADYDVQAKRLVKMFSENFVQFKDYVSSDILKICL